MPHLGHCVIEPLNCLCRYLLGNCTLCGINQLPITVISDQINKNLFDFHKLVNAT